MKAEDKVDQLMPRISSLTNCQSGKQLLLVSQYCQDINLSSL